MTQPIAISTIGVRNRASFNGAGATTVDMAAFGESTQMGRGARWSVIETAAKRGRTTSKTNHHLC